jgi:hypothetical protein
VIHRQNTNTAAPRAQEAKRFKHILVPVWLLTYTYGQNGGLRF